jgi:multiple sugar transport system permease protein
MKRVWHPLTHIILAGWAIVMIFPFVWMVATSFKPAPEIIQFPPHIFPQSPTFSNYRRVFDTAPFGRYFLNSIVVTAVSTVIVVITSTLGGYVFGKHRFPGATIIFIVFLATAIIPLEVYMIPLYLLMRDWRWINTYQGMIAPFLVLSFGLFIMRQYFRSTIPDELLDAARIDGGSEWYILVKVALPLSTSAIAAVAILAGIQAWTAFIWPLVIASSQDMYTMEVGLAFFQQRYTVDYGAITAGATLSLIPIVCLFLMFRRYITEGIALTGFR